MNNYDTLIQQANEVRNSILVASPIQIYETLTGGLERLRILILETCNQVDKNSRSELEWFKERVHAAYSIVADVLKPSEFSARQFYEIPLIVYRRMLVTTQECAKLTGYPFDMGFEYANLSVSEIGIGNYEASFSHLELANVEDDRIGHKGGVAGSNLENVVFENAYLWAAHMTSQFTIQQVKEMCRTKLDWTERCRFAKAMWRFESRIADNRSSLNNEDMERNLVNLCKTVETYLKRNHPLPKVPAYKQTLSPLIEYTFSKHEWFNDWVIFAQSEKLDYADPSVDDMKLSNVLLDKSRSRQTNMFLALCIIRNFGTHSFNDRSVLFNEREYAIAFKMLVEALMYTLANT